MARNIYHTPRISLAQLAQTGFSQPELTALSALDTAPHDHYLEQAEIATGLMLLPQKETVGKLFMLADRYPRFKKDVAQIFANLQPNGQIEVLKQVDSSTQTGLLNFVLKSGEQGYNNLAHIVNALTVEDRNGRFGALLLLGLRASHPDIVQRLEINPFLRGWRYLQAAQEQMNLFEGELRSNHAASLSYAPSEDSLPSGTAGKSHTEITRRYQLTFFHPCHGGVAIKQSGMSVFVPSGIYKPVATITHAATLSTPPPPPPARKMADGGVQIDGSSQEMTGPCSETLLRTGDPDALIAIARVKSSHNRPGMRQDAVRILQAVLARKPDSIRAHADLAILQEDSDPRAALTHYAQIVYYYENNPTGPHAIEERIYRFAQSQIQLLGQIE